VDEKLVRELTPLRFLDDASNVLFVGPPGVGKTMLSVGLARVGVEAGHRVYFTTAADLAARCHKAAIEGRWATCMRFFAGPRLLVIDLCRTRNYAEGVGGPAVRAWLWWASGPAGW
jgi:DNA replication protein DnaC